MSMFSTISEVQTTTEVDLLTSCADERQKSIHNRNIRAERIISCVDVSAEIKSVIHCARHVVIYIASFGYFRNGRVLSFHLSLTIVLSGD